MTLLTPTDGCPACVTITKGSPVHPYKVAVNPEGTSLRAWYECPCGFSWDTGWAASALALGCPGCSLCRVEAGAA
jgi:hypothetical protein